MLQIEEFCRKTRTLPILVVNEALRYWLDAVGASRLNALGLGRLTPRFDGTARQPQAD